MHLVPNTAEALDGVALAARFDAIEADLRDRRGQGIRRTEILEIIAREVADHVLAKVGAVWKEFALNVDSSVVLGRVRASLRLPSSTTSEGSGTKVDPETKRLLLIWLMEAQREAVRRADRDMRAYELPGTPAYDAEERFFVAMAEARDVLSKHLEAAAKLRDKP